LITFRTASCATRKKSLHVATELDRGLHVQRRLDPASLGSREQIAERRREAGAMELGRIDLHEQRAQLADPMPGLGGGLTQLRIERRRGTFRRGGE